MFQEEPTAKVKQYFDTIGQPYQILGEIFSLIKYITNVLKEDLSHIHPSQLQTYRDTSKDFEKIFS